jgi:hypothetical protein
MNKRLYRDILHAHDVRERERRDHARRGRYDPSIWQFTRGGSKRCETTQRQAAGAPVR